MRKVFEGVVTAEIIEARFAYAGRVVSTRKKTGEMVRQWEIIASLDRKLLQTELDRQLADYEKVRADFEIFALKNQQNSDDITKFLRQEKQAQLNASVKDVEIAKYKLDQADVVSPVSGVIIDMEGLVNGLNVTPSSNPVKILNTQSLKFSFQVLQEQLIHFLESKKVEIKIPGLEKTYTGVTSAPIWGREGIFTTHATLEDTQGLLPGMRGVSSII